MGWGLEQPPATYLPPLRPRARWVSISLSWLLSRAVAVPGCCRWEASNSASSEVEMASLIAAGSGMVMVCLQSEVGRRTGSQQSEKRRQRTEQGQRSGALTAPDSRQAGSRQSKAAACGRLHAAVQLAHNGVGHGAGGGGAGVGQHNQQAQQQGSDGLTAPHG